MLLRRWERSLGLAFCVLLERNRSRSRNKYVLAVLYQSGKIRGELFLRRDLLRDAFVAVVGVFGGPELAGLDFPIDRIFMSAHIKSCFVVRALTCHCDDAP